MNNRLNQILLGILVVQLALVGFVFWPRQAGEAKGGPLLGDFQAAAVTGLTIRDADGNQVTLAKKDEQWVLPDADDFPAQTDRVTEFLDKVEKIQANRLVTRTEASHKRLKVAENDYNRLLELTLSGGESRRLFVGSSAGAGATHVRVDPDPNVYLTNALNVWDADTAVSRWIDTLYFSVPTTATVALKLENANGVFEFEKQDDRWTMAGLSAGETLDEDAVRTLVNYAAAVRMTEPLGKTAEASFGLDQPAAVVTVKTGDGEYTLTFGAPAGTEEKSYVVKASNSDYYVRVSAFTGDTFANKTRQDFLKEAPTPTPEAEGGGS